MPGYKDFVRAGVGRFADDQLDMVNGLIANEETESLYSKVERESQRNGTSTSELLKEQVQLRLSATSLCLSETERTKRLHHRAKPVEQIAIEVFKRRNKNKNKKTHRKR